jgi:hypothetical protein
MREAFDAACGRLKQKQWKPSARELTGMNGSVVEASSKGLQCRLIGASMLMPWKSLKPLARQRFFEGASARPDARVWTARIAYALFTDLGERALVVAQRAVPARKGPTMASEGENRSANRCEDIVGVLT